MSRPGWTALLAIALLALAPLGCRCDKSDPAAGGPSALIPGQPLITLEGTGYTYERENQNHRVQLRVTFENPGKQPVRIRWDQLLAEADGPMAGPTWDTAPLPSELPPGDRVVAQASWYYVGSDNDRPRSILVTYRSPDGHEVLRRKVPVKVLATSGFSFRLSLPATATLVASPQPLRGQSWEVRINAEVRNPTEGPLIFVPFWFQAEAGSQRAIHACKASECLRSITRIDPGRRIRGALVWRFRGSGPRPEGVKVTFPAGSEPEFSETLEVKAPAK